MSDATSEAASFPYHLTHPLYLDVSMMLSFLAHIQGGVAEQTAETQQTTGSLAKSRAVKATIGFDLGAAVTAKLGAEGGIDGSDTHSLEVKAQRHHTNASLFNVLYEYLSSEDQLFILSQPDQLSRVRTGQLVELEGEYRGNPFEDFMKLLDSLLKLVSNVGSGAQTTGGGTKSASRAATASTPRRDVRAGDEMSLQRELIQQAANSPVHDLLMRTGSGLDAILTVSSQYYSDEINESLRAGTFRAIGKVTRILTGADEINLARRTVLRVMGGEAARELLNSAEQGSELALDDTTTVVDGPAVQILPMAIFV